MKDSRQELLTLLAQNSFRLGAFKLSSGGTSDYYIDCRTTTLHAEGARLTAHVFMDEMRSRGWHAQAIGGMTMGADPIVVGVAMLSAQQAQAIAPAAKPGNTSDFLIHGFLVRKLEKAHGTGQRIEGFRQKGARVVIVDDVCTTGASTVQAIEAAREFGFDVVGAMSLVEREEAGGRLAVERAAAPAPFVTIFRAAEVRAEHLKLNRRADDAPPKFSVSAKCELCERTAVANTPRHRCAMHQSEEQA
ncbi:MAG TPA: orotate phosphoribosyltransferase [Clostridia bacterium]|nr:orotate phosphoribosyltransferase [Clostridia bacterium]